MNVIVISVNGCPVTALGPYGNEWVGTPHLDQFADEGIVFDRHLSDCPEPQAARRAWLTGRHQFPVLEPGGITTTVAPTYLLPLLTAAGARAVLVRHTRTSDDSFSEFYDGWSEKFDATFDPTDDSPIESLLRMLPTVIDRLANTRRWLLWIECDRLVPPWHIPQVVFEAYVEDLFEGNDVDSQPDVGGEPESDEEGRQGAGRAEAGVAEAILPWADPPTGWFDPKDGPSWELLHRSFAAAVTSFDADLGRVFELLRSHHLDQACWILTSDRGQPLGEHGIIGPHRPWLHEELVHLPLIVRLPGGREAGRRVAAMTQPADLMPTLASILGVSPASESRLHGVDLTPLIFGTATSVREVACTGLELESSAEWSIRTDRWAYLLPVRSDFGDEPREPMLFAKPDDRWEVNNLRLRYLETADDLDRLLRKTLEQLTQS